MLQNIRDKSKGPILTILVGAICLMFAASGMETMLGTGSSSGVAKVNGEKITDQDLSEAIFLEKKRLISEMGNNIDSEMLKDEKIKQPALDSLVKQKLLLQMADEHNMIIADSEINSIIAKNPDFQENGQFSNERLQSVLSSAGLTIALFKKLYSNEMLINQLTGGVLNSEFITDKDALINTRFIHQTRDIKYITLELQKEKAKTIVTEEEVKKYYESNASEFQSEESVILEFIQLSRSTFNPDISDSEVLDAYNLEVAAFKSEETRDVSHILIEINNTTTKEIATKKLLDLKAKIDSGELFADIARQYSEDLGSKESGGVLGPLDVEKSPKPLVKAAKLLAEGGISDVVETDAGLHLLQVTKITIPKMPSIDERREFIVADLQKAKSTPLYLEAVEKLKDVSFNSADLIDPAASLNLTVQVSSAVTRKGGEGIFSNVSLYKAAFSEDLLKGEQNSDVIEIDADNVAVIHVKKHNPAALIPFDKVTSQAKDLLIEKNTELRLEELVRSIRQELDSGTDIQDVGNKYSIGVSSSEAVKRHATNIDKKIIDVAFKLPKSKNEMGVSDSVQLDKGDFVIISVTNIKDGLLADQDPSETKSMKSYLSRIQGSEEFKAIEAGIKSKATIDIY